MRVAVIESGGFLGLRRGLTLDTEGLPAEVAEEMHQLVAACRFFTLPQSIRFNDGPDKFWYTVSVTDGAQFHEVVLHLDAISVPAELKNLMGLAAQYAEMKYLPSRR